MLLSALVAPSARADDQSWTSLYAGTEYDGSGWASCPDPIRISVDTRALDPAQKAKARKALKAVLAVWNKAKVYPLVYGGEIPVRFDKATGVSTPEDGVTRDRWIYLTLVKASKKATSDTAVVGLGGPLRVDPDNKVIVEASAAFQAQYVNKTSKALVEELFAHELGHVIGLGHSTSKKDVMYPILSGHLKLGPGDIAGAWALIRPCPTSTAPPAA
ncbi:MAG: matrixin family metalloprotease [Actinomycetales bacterium]|nr:matrixin family metalloprotease [Actinomycetales bacterium]